MGSMEGSSVNDPKADSVGTSNLRLKRESTLPPKPQTLSYMKCLVS